MIAYFTGTGNSLAVSQKIAAATGDAVVPMAAAAAQDLSDERTVGLVYPCYDFNTPPAVRELVAQMNISPDAYVFIVITCGAQTGNSIWTVRRLLAKKGVRVAYCHKIRMPDNSAALFGRNPNDQLWKLRRYASRLDRIAADIAAGRHGRHFGAPGLAGWLAGIPVVERKLLAAFRPSVDRDRCIGCGICAEACPIGNITVEGKAAVGPHCTSCLGCLHACPRQAMTAGGKRVTKDRQYRHPDIQAIPSVNP